MTKQIVFDERAHAAVLAGVSKLAQAVQVTLGPRGRHVILDRAPAGPVVTRDGVTVARELELEDPLENIGAQLVKQVAIRTSEEAGDGTTTATVLARAIFTQGLKAVAAGVSPILLQRGMLRALTNVTATLRKMAVPVQGRRQLAQVATVACNHDGELGELLADAVHRSGKDGIVMIENGQTARSEIEWIDGLRWDHGYLSPYFVTDALDMDGVLEDAAVLLCEGTLSQAEDLIPIVEACYQAARPLLVVAADVTATALSLLAINHTRGVLRCCAVKAPSFGDKRVELLHDIAAATGTSIVSDAGGRTVAATLIDELGRARKVIVGRDSTTIVGGRRDATAFQLRIDAVERDLAAAATATEREHLSLRLAGLRGRAARLFIGGQTEAELHERKARAEDALQACRAALTEGLLPGGGLALLRASAELERNSRPTEDALGYDVVLRACREPLIGIAANAGQSGTAVCHRILESRGTVGFNAATNEVEDLAEAGVMDPLKVTRVALENAVSVSTLLLTSSALVVEQNGAPATN